MRFHGAMNAISRPIIGLALLAGLLSPLALSAAEKPAREYLVFLGTSGRATKGIYVSRFNPATGKLSEPELAAEARNPSFLAVHPSLQYLYAVGETGGRGQAGTVSAFSLDRKSGKLTLLNTASSVGSGPCHLVVDRSGKNVLVANYGSGSVAVLPIKADGSLAEHTAFIQHQGSSVDRSRQEGPHAHSINVSSDNRFAIVADLGLDQVLVYRFDPAKGSLEPNDPPFAKVAPGSGPRHFTFHPNGKYGYVINEMGSTVTAFGWDAKRGAFQEIQTISTLPPGAKEKNYDAEVITDRAGRFLYGSNRGHDSIALFSIEPGKGTLKFVETVPSQGKFPRNFNLDPTGAWMLVGNQNSDNVAVYKVDRATGRLTPTGDQVKAPSPICIKFVPAE